MPIKNPSLSRLKGNYLFPEVNKRVEAFRKLNPEAKILRLGIGDTTEPIAPSVVEQLKEASIRLGTLEGYMGYGLEMGSPELRKKIAEVIYKNAVDPGEIFISDGSKCDVGRLLHLFSHEQTIGVQDPTYPAYVDASVIHGYSEELDVATKQYSGISYLPCTPENNFFPDLNCSLDILFFCSPNNPTGAVATKEQLEALVKFAKAKNSLILFDRAYSDYIQGEHFPRSIYEIANSKKHAIEMGSFSKMAGFTGLRLGWTVVPFDLKFEDGSSINETWQRIQSTIFNGASRIVQHAALAVLEPKGQTEVKATISKYMENCHKLKNSLEKIGLQCFGGDHAPYIWAKIPKRTSWEAFEYFLEKAHIVTTPGVGFGPSGEGYLRFSSFGQSKDIDEAIFRINKCRDLC